MANLASTSVVLMLWLINLVSYSYIVHVTAQWPRRSSTRFYDFKVQSMRITKLCNTRNIVTANRIFPGPVIYAQEDDRIIVKITNETPYNTTIHWHVIRQRLSCWFDGPSYITQCPIQAGQSFTYEFTLVQQKGTFFWHAHVSWLRATVYGAFVVYPKTGVPFPFKHPYKEHIIILGEYWNQVVVQLERTTTASGGSPPVADAYTINGHPGPNYNCSNNYSFHNMTDIQTLKEVAVITSTKKKPQSKLKWLTMHLLRRQTTGLLPRQPACANEGLKHRLNFGDSETGEALEQEGEHQCGSTRSGKWGQ